MCLRNARSRIRTEVLEQIEPFQSEPQLLDARLKFILPSVVAAFLDYLTLPPKSDHPECVDLQTAASNILYTFCKVRGSKVVVGFFNNEPRFLEPILQALEKTLAPDGNHAAQETWQVSYVLMLWLSHLLLTPFDLATISNIQGSNYDVPGLDLCPGLPHITVRCLKIGLQCLSTSMKVQDAAAAMLVRLSIRPDSQRLHLAESLTESAIRSIHADRLDMPTAVYRQLGSLRVLAGLVTSADLDHLVPSIYRACGGLSIDEGSTAIGSNAVARKIIIKILRNIVLLSLRSAIANGRLTSFVQDTSVVEDVIDYLLRSLGDRDTPVRYAAAKAISLIVLELDLSMGHEVIQAVLDTFKEDMPRQGSAIDFRTASPLKWHGLTLALGHVLFKRTASPEQLPDIVSALMTALQFEQRTTTGSSAGTNVRDAANFGIWSLSRRYSTAELLLADNTALKLWKGSEISVIQAMGIQLMLSACLDPAGNIRRGSSAALQEMIGRHPDHVHEGIALVQVIDHQAVGLRRRAMVDIAGRAAQLHSRYWEAFVDAILGWRGIGSADVLSREAAATSLSNLSRTPPAPTKVRVLDKVLQRLAQSSQDDVEYAHGLISALGGILEESQRHPTANYHVTDHYTLWQLVPRLSDYVANFSPRILRAELPAAVVRFLAALCRAEVVSKHIQTPLNQHAIPFGDMESLAESLLARSEEGVLQNLPAFSQAMLSLKRGAGLQLGCIKPQSLSEKVLSTSSRNTLIGAGRLITLGALAAIYLPGLTGEQAASAINVIATVATAIAVEWRIIAMRAFQLVLKSVASEDHLIDKHIVERMTGALQSALSDYTIDERGDIGSLVRLQGIACASTMFAVPACTRNVEMMHLLQAEIIRLSLEKLDRVRLQAAECRRRYLGFKRAVTDVESVSTFEYFYDAIEPLRGSVGNAVIETALLKGCISCAGISAESLMMAARDAIADSFQTLDDTRLATHMATIAGLLKHMIAENDNTHPALEFLAFLLDMQFPQKLPEVGFRWRNLLSSVQKSHHKSTDIPKILAAIHVYRGLADIPSIHHEVTKKLIGMLSTHPYPRVRLAVSETLLLILKDDRLRHRDWRRPPAQNKDAVDQLRSLHQCV